jgi:hypothetical protein
MILSVLEYAEKFPCKGKVLSRQAIISRCVRGLLPSDHHARQLPCESGDKKGQWVIEVPDRTSPEIIVTKLNPPKPDIQTLNRKYFTW